MTNRDFDKWLSKFRPSISTYDYYVDFGKVYRNVDEVKIELNILNSLIGSKDIKTDFVNLLKRYPEILKAVPILLAKRENEIYCQDEKGGFLYKFDYGKYPPNSHRYYEMYTYFMEKTGLFDLLQNHIIKDLVDYVTGVETGLDSNGRKNRGGHLMEDLVEKYIQEAGFVRDYFLMVGKGDSASQSAYFTSVKGTLGEYKRKAAEECAKYGDLYLKLGFLCGLMILVIII